MSVAPHNAGVVSPGSAKTYRVARRFLWIGVGCGAFFLAMGTISVVAALTSVDGSAPHPERMAVFFALWWGAMTLLGAYLTAVALRGRLVVDDRSLTWIGLFRPFRVEWRAVERAVWRARPAGGSVKLWSAGRTCAIELDLFERSQSREVAALLRERLPISVQEKWDAYLAAGHTVKLTPDDPQAEALAIAEKRAVEWEKNLNRTPALVAGSGAFALLFAVASLLPLPRTIWPSLMPAAMLAGILTVAFLAIGVLNAVRRPSRKLIAAVAFSVFATTVSGVIF
ncbi:MAG TPA: hypothetical protein VGE52_01725 [Pirellulales bacterium]